MTMASAFVTAMRPPEAWNISAQHTAKRIDPEFDYDRLEQDLAFYYFKDGSKAGVRPMSHQAWVSEALPAEFFSEDDGDAMGQMMGRNV